MSEPKTALVIGEGDSLKLTLREAKHPKSKKLTMYLSFANGSGDIAGAYVNQESLKEIGGFFNGRKSSAKSK